MREFFPKALRLRTRRQFQQMAYKAKRSVGQWMLIDVKPNHKVTTRLGITASRRYGKSHERNRFKRLVREAFRLSAQFHSLGCDLNVRPRSAAKTAKMIDIKNEFISLIGTTQPRPTPSS